MQSAMKSQPYGANPSYTQYNTEQRKLSHDEQLTEQYKLGASVPTVT